MSLVQKIAASFTVLMLASILVAAATIDHPKLQKASKLVFGVSASVCGAYALWRIWTQV